MFYSLCLFNITIHCVKTDEMIKMCVGYGLEWSQGTIYEVEAQTSIFRVVIPKLQPIVKY